MPEVSRRQFLRGDLRGERGVLRPPWVIEINQFFSICSRCDDCIGACPETILKKDSNGYPQTDFYRGECTFCGACAESCGTGALNLNQSSPWQSVADVGDSCLAHRGIVCSSCGEQCEVEALQMHMVAGGVALPRILKQNCNGCGACVSVCPANAIVIQDLSQ